MVDTLWRRKYSSLSLFGELIRENYTKTLQDGLRALQDGDLNTLVFGQRKGAKTPGNESKTLVEVTSFVASQKKRPIMFDETLSQTHHHCTVSVPK